MWRERVRVIRPQSPLASFESAPKVCLCFLELALLIQEHPNIVHGEHRVFMVVDVLQSSVLKPPSLLPGELTLHESLLAQVAANLKGDERRLSLLPHLLECLPHFRPCRQEGTVEELTDGDTALGRGGERGREMERKG